MIDCHGRLALFNLRSVQRNKAAGPCVDNVVRKNVVRHVPLHLELAGPGFRRIVFVQRVVDHRAVIGVPSLRRIASDGNTRSMAVIDQVISRSDVTGARTLYLDHVSAHIGEQLGAGGSRLHVGKVENAHALQRQAGVAVGLAARLRQTIAVRLLRWLFHTGELHDFARRLFGRGAALRFWTFRLGHFRFLPLLNHWADAGGANAARIDHYWYMVWFSVPGAYSLGSTQTLTTADLPGLATISRACLSAGAILEASRTSIPQPPHCCGECENSMSQSLLPTLLRCSPYLAI